MYVSRLGLFQLMCFTKTELSQEIDWNGCGSPFPNKIWDWILDVNCWPCLVKICIIKLLFKFRHMNGFQLCVFRLPFDSFVLLLCCLGSAAGEAGSLRFEREIHGLGKTTTTITPTVSHIDYCYCNCNSKFLGALQMILDNLTTEEKDWTEEFSSTYGIEVKIKQGADMS